MFISLAGDGAQFTNKLFNPIEIKPNSYVCLHNFSCKKNEIITIEVALPFYFMQDYNNVFEFTIPVGSYSIYSLSDKFNEIMEANPMERFKVRSFITNANMNELRFNLEYSNVPMPSLDFGIVPENVAGNPFDTLYNVNFGPQNNGVDAAGRGTFKDTGASVAAQSYISIPSEQTTIPGMSDGKQTLGICSFLTGGAPLYVPINKSGTPAAGYDSQTQATNFIQTAVVQATGQKYNDENLPIQIENTNKPEFAANYKQADIMRTTGFTSWINGATATKDFILCVGKETLDSSGNTSTNLITDITDYSDGDKNTDKRLWIRWNDPRNNGSKMGMDVAFWKYVASTDDKEWVTANVRLPEKNEERMAQEGNKFTMTFVPNPEGKAPNSIYHPKVVCDTLTYRSASVPKDVFTHNICFWDMDAPFSSSGDFFYTQGHNKLAGKFKNTNPLHSKYQYLWNNIGSGRDGAANSGHMWGTTIGRDESFSDNYDMGLGFELRTGAGSLDFTQSQNISKTPGFNPTAFGVSRSFNNTDDGYQNAFYKLPNMWGTELTRTYKGALAGAPAGTVLPATMPARTIGSYYMSICFRLDSITETKYQCIYTYEGNDPVTGVATDPHTMLGVKIGASTLLVSDGGPAAGDRQEVPVTKQSDSTAFTFEVNKWYNIAIVFQKQAGPAASQWEIVGIDEDGVKFIANPTVGKTPTKPILGIGGNEICNGTQTVSTGMVGNIKLFKIGYFFGDDLVSGTAYSADELTALCCSDMFGEKTNSNFSDWSYENEVETLSVFEDKTYADSIWGCSQPDFDNPLTVLYGNTIHGANISNYNPYDTLFTAPIWRNVSDCEPQNIRTNDPTVVLDFIEGGGAPLQNNDFGFILNEAGGFGYLVGLPKLIAYINFVTLLSENPIGEINGDSNIDTEIGLNDNRIHIDNLPIQSYNGLVGSMDRAIYQTGSVLPVREIGSNFVNDSITVPSKVWIPLRNAGSLYLNEFNVKITDIEDKLDEELLSSQLNIEIKDEKEMLISK